LAIQIENIIYFEKPMSHPAGPNFIRKETTLMANSTMEVTKKKYLTSHPKNKGK